MAVGSLLKITGEIMACRGIHFALSSEEVAKLTGFSSDDERLFYLTEELEETYFAERQEDLAESDKAWDAMHRALSDGHFTYDSGPYPFNHVVLGGKPIYAEEDYIMSLKTPAQVKATAEAIAPLTKEDFQSRYNKIDPEQYGMNLSEEDFEYTWDWFQGVRALFSKAVIDDRFILFTADQ